MWITETSETWQVAPLAVPHALVVTWAAGMAGFVWTARPAEWHADWVQDMVIDRVSTVPDLWHVQQS